MSNDQRPLLDRYTGRPSSRPTATTKDAAADEPDYQPANPVSSNRPPEMMLELRFQAGDAVAVSYALLGTAKFNPSEGIQLDFTGHRVQVMGRNLRELFRALTQHRLQYLQELPERLDDQPESATVITSIQMTSD